MKVCLLVQENVNRVVGVLIQGSSREPFLFQAFWKSFDDKITHVKTVVICQQTFIYLSPELNPS